MHHTSCQTSHSCKADVMKCVFPPCHTDTIVLHCDIILRYFKEHGVLTLGAGKLFHPELPPHYDTPYSWSHGDASDPLNLSLPYVAPGDPAVGTSPLYSNPKALSGCSNTSGEAVEGDMDHWCSINMSRLIEVHPEYVQVHVCLLSIAAVSHMYYFCVSTFISPLRASLHFSPNHYHSPYSCPQPRFRRTWPANLPPCAAIGNFLGTHLSWPSVIATCNLCEALYRTLFVNSTQP